MPNAEEEVPMLWLFTAPRKLRALGIVIERAVWSDDDQRD